MSARDLWHPRRWSQLSEVDRVDLYTRQSLYLLLWLLVGFVLAAGVGERPGAAATAVVIGGSVVVTALGTALMHAVFEMYPATRPLPWRRLTPFLVAAAALLAFGLASENAVRGAAVMVVMANLAWGLGGLPDNRVAGVIVVVCALLFWVSSGLPGLGLGGFAAGAFFVFTVRASLWLLGVVTELDDARRAQSLLAVAEERLRFSRDVHDVLGRRLSTIAVQSELAATLAERGDGRAATQMLEVRGVAHEALREARELARGYRSTDLATELEGARSLLRSAGIEVRHDVADLPRGWQEAAAWVVREGATNVLRHSSATVLQIGWDDGRLRLVNDGVDEVRSDGGAGLTGLRERLRPLGGELEAGPGEPGTWSLTARLPGSGPLSATSSRSRGSLSEAGS